MKCETDLQVLTPVIYQHEAGSVLFSEKPWEPQCLLLCGGVDDPTTVTQLGLGKKLKENKKKKTHEPSHTKVPFKKVFGLKTTVLETYEIFPSVLSALSWLLLCPLTWIFWSSGDLN